VIRHSSSNSSNGGNKGGNNFAGSSVTLQSSWAKLKKTKDLVVLTVDGTLMAITAIHPGEHLAGELKALGMSAAELARQLNVPTNRITQIMNGQRAITGDTALRLGHFFGTSAEFWLNLQNLYALRLAEQKAGKSIRVLPTLKKHAPAHP
jgi:addiction module HigA family antidote